SWRHGCSAGPSFTSPRDPSSTRRGIERTQASRTLAAPRASPRLAKQLAADVSYASAEATICPPAEVEHGPHADRATDDHSRSLPGALHRRSGTRSSAGEVVRAAGSDDP